MSGSEDYHEMKMTFVRDRYDICHMGHREKASFIREGLKGIGVTVEDFRTLYSPSIRVTPVCLITGQ